MASFTMQDVAILVGGHDFSTDSNQVTFSVERDAQDVTTFRSGGSRARIGGLKTLSCDVSGFWQEDDRPVDSNLFANHSGAGQPVTLSPDFAAGNTAYMFKGGQFSYEILGAVGDAAPFSLSMMGTDGREGAVRGLVSAVDEVVSGTGDFGDLEFSAAPAAGQFVYAVIHVLEAETSLSIDLESADDAGFTSATQHSFPTITATGGYWLTRIAGPLADQTFWRFNVTAVTGSFTVSCAIGVQ